MDRQNFRKIISLQIEPPAILGQAIIKRKISIMENLQSRSETLFLLATTREHATMLKIST